MWRDICLDQVEDLGILAVGDGEMRDDLVELPSVRRSLRPPLRNLVCEGSEADVGHRRGIEDRRKPPALTELSPEGLVPRHQGLQVLLDAPIDELLVEERKQDRNVCGHSCCGGHVESAAPLPHDALGLGHRDDQAGGPSLEAVPVIGSHASLPPVATIQKISVVERKSQPTTAIDAAESATIPSCTPERRPSLASAQNSGKIGSRNRGSLISGRLDQAVQRKNTRLPQV